MRKLLWCLLLLIPTASAHGSPDPLDVEVLIVSDDASDASYIFDGYDLGDVYIRDAYWDLVGQEGVIVRAFATGGLVATASAAHIDFVIGNASARFTTTDDQTWESDAVIVEASVADGDVEGIYSANLQVFFSYEDLGIQQGDHLEGFEVLSYADDMQVDSTQAGMFVAGQEVPSADTPAQLGHFETAAPDQYTISNWTQEGLEVESQISTAGMHLMIMLGEVDGWSYELQDQAVTEIGASATYTLPITFDAIGSDGLPVTIINDLGGKEQGYLVANGTGVAWSTNPGGTTNAAADEDAPAPALALLALALLAVAFKRRA